MKRGFKSQCERRSAEIRRTLGFAPHDPLNAFRLAEHQGVTVWPESEVTGLSKADFEQLTVTSGDEWLAFALRLRTRFLVVYNSSQSAERVNSVIMHELSHIMLGHELSSAGVSDEGHLMPMIYDQDQEDEANWLGGTLLLPRPALLSVRKRRLSDAQIKTEYGVSGHMLRWRFRMTGVDYQLANARSRA